MNQLVSTSQVMSSGFTSATDVPLNLEQMSFEWGQGRLRTDVALSDLNGGDGVERGSIRIQDRAGQSAIVDLSRATTIQEVLDTINDESAIQVTASISGDGLEIVDTSGGAGDIVVSNEGGTSTAGDLGILGSNSGTTLVGGDINRIGESSLLSSWNDGNGVFIRDNGVTDLRLQVGATTYDIDLGRQDTPITLDTVLEDLNNGQGVEINEDSEAPDFTVVTSTGVEIDVDLGDLLDDDGEIDTPAVTTVSELLIRVNTAIAAEVGSSQVVMDLRADGKGFEIVDSLGGADEPTVVGAGPNGDGTASDLGILGVGSGGTLTGGLVPNKVETPQAQTVGDLIERIAEQTAGAVTASIAPGGEGLRLNAAGATVTVLAGDIDGSSFGASVGTQTLRNLGFEENDSGVSVSGDRVLSGFGTVLVDSLNGGAGLGGASSLTFTDSEGDTITITDLDQYDTLREVVDAIQDALGSSTVDIDFRYNTVGNGFEVIDRSRGATGNLQVSGDMAEALGIAGDVAVESIRGGNLQLQYVDLASSLEDLNYGRGVGKGEFRITGSSGESATIKIGSDSRTLYDVVKEINARMTDVEARLNDQGDGLVLIDTNSGTPITAMKVESVSGSTARDLGILGEASEPGEDIDGSYERTVELETTDTLDDVIGKINEAGIEVSASLLDTGTGGSPYRLVLSSGISGLAGDLVVDTGDVELGLSTLTEARNAKVFIGEGENAVVVESTSNTVEDIVAGVTLELLSTSDSPITVNVTRDEDSIDTAITAFVDGFNSVIEAFNGYDSYDSETETRGPLLGDPTVSRIRSEMYRTLQQRAVGVDTQYQYLSEVGIRVSTDGKIKLDESKFAAAYDADPAAVKNLFEAFKQQGSSTRTIGEGITVQESTTSYSSLGFGDLFDQLSERLTNSIDGTLTVADRQFQTLIDAQDDRLERIDERLDSKRLRLQRQFAAMEETLARLQSQQSSLGAISQNIATAGALLG
ncbi:MAG: flagellar filament capping protein FliD [Phycisphaera sp.]|nr:flagellar filament capping protein FliD [Phycisphaera sp.]